MKARPGTSMARAWLASAIAAYSIVSYFLEHRDGGDWSNWNHAVGAIALVVYLRKYYKDERDVVLTGFEQIFATLEILVSTAIVSTGVFMFEVAQFGTQNGIFWVVVGFFVVGFEASGFGYRVADRISLRPKVRRFPWRFEQSMILAITGVSLLLCAYVLARYRGPLLLGLDRATFWRTIAPSYLSFIPSLVIQSFFFVAYYFLWMRRIAKPAKLPLLILFAYIAATLLVLGQKFSAFTIYMNAWFVLLPGILPRFKVKARHLMVLGSIVVLLAVSVVVSYVLMGRDALFVFARVALQAQVLWSVFDDTRHLSLWPQQWSCFLHCGQFDDGKDFISFAYLPHLRYVAYADGGTELSGWMPALPILTMGFVLALVVHVVVSTILGFFQRKVVAAISRENMVYGFLLFKVHLGLTLWWFAGTQSAARSIFLTLFVIALYRACFPARAGLETAAPALSTSHS